MCLLAAPPLSSDLSAPNLFPVCAITRAQARKIGETVDLSETFLATLDDGEPSFSVTPTTVCENVKGVNETDIFSASSELCFNVTKEMFVAQKKDPSLTVFFLH